MRTVDPCVWAGALRRGGGAAGARRFGARAAAAEGAWGWERAARRGMQRALQDFVRHTRAPNAPMYERRWWVAGGLVVLVLGTALLASGPSPPVVRVSLPSLEHSIAQLPFPAVALCSYNLISRAAATGYAQYLSSRSSAAGYNYSERAIFTRLLHFGALINFSRPPVDLEFTEFLRRVDAPRGGNVTQVMMTLTRDCSSQLLACGWRGRREPCESLFATRPTPLGLCCVFNGRYVPSDRSTPARVLNVVGPEHGLFVVVQRRMDNQAYLRKMAVGTELLLFDGDQYPLLEGDTRTLSARSDESTHIVLSASELRASEALRRLPERTRGCRYRSGGASAQSSYVWCLTWCRRAALRRLCGCVPFQLLPQPEDFVCTINQLYCLNKYREKLMRYYPGDEAIGSAALREELSDSLDCDHCLPDCSRIRYSAASYVSKYYEGERIFRNYYSFDSVVTNSSSVLRLFYSTEAQRLYELEEPRLWYERVGAAGGVFALLGGSVPLLLELLHCATRRCWVRVRQEHTRLQHQHTT